MTSPAEPQPILAPLTGSAIFLSLTIDPGGEDAVRDLLADLSGLLRSVGFRVPAAALTCVVGIGSDAWDRLFAGPRPARLHPFVPLQGVRHEAPATPADLLFHFRAGQMDACFELASQIMNRLSGATTAVDEVHGFRFFEVRDLLGFVDGTENPGGNAAARAVLIGDEDPDFTGGSYVIVQKYVHDLDTWNALSTDEQERVIGRSKLTDIEMPDEVKPANSHVALNVVQDENGVQLQILRDNMPFGRVGTAEFGTYFIGYARDPAVTETMLRNMFLGNPAGNYDRILDFSTARTGALFFVPTADFLDDPPPAPDSTPAVAAPTGASDQPAVDGSLGIGSLKPS
ncbi:putative iron-dependent peroxidase [Nakamurella panacisegetis]|uniref:Putative iron-dependent peroxidase n=1 Tax=Nakamurella panacisegetis TaxID=1090615 RepID=A0A1H0HK15_9ACTN|nr:Dyp-type peroxidase [Nakamurella panacisegetis]SDO19535.1 putative iron-dependent peroxidase [Nakamurella panacisegetis]